MLSPQLNGAAVTTNAGDDIIPIATKYLYVTTRSLPRNPELLKIECLVCREPPGRACFDCTAKGKMCPFILGECAHAFHVHCLAEWNQGTCPMCQKPWREKELIEDY